jgi:hypothetical protein
VRAGRVAAQSYEALEGPAGDVLHGDGAGHRLRELGFDPVCLVRVDERGARAQLDDVAGQLGDGAQRADLIGESGVGDLVCEEGLQATKALTCSAPRRRLCTTICRTVSR